MSGVAFASAPPVARIRDLYDPREDLREVFAEVSSRTPRVLRAHHRSETMQRAMKSARLFDKGRDAFVEKLAGWTADVQKAMLLDLSVAGTYNKLITGVTAASPAVYTSTAHGFSNGDLICVLGVGGTLTANQLGLAASVAANTFQLTTLEGAAVVGTGAYTSGGFAVNLTQAQFVAGILGNRVGTDQTLAATSSVKGIVTATSPITWPTVTAGNPVQAVVFYDAAGGADATNRLIAWQDGKVRVVVDQAVLAAATTIVIEPLRGQLWDGVTGAAPVLYWSDGHTSTLAAAANQGDRALTITSQAAGGVAIGSTAEMNVFGGGLPVTPSGGNISFTIGSILVVGTGIFQL